MLSALVVLPERNLTTSWDYYPADTGNMWSLSVQHWSTQSSSETDLMHVRLLIPRKTLSDKTTANQNIFIVWCTCGMGLWTNKISMWERLQVQCNDIAVWLQKACEKSYGQFLWDFFVHSEAWQYKSFFYRAQIFSLTLPFVFHKRKMGRTWGWLKGKTSTAIQSLMSFHFGRM